MKLESAHEFHTEKRNKTQIDERQHNLNDSKGMPLDFNMMIEEKLSEFKTEIEVILKKDNERIFVQEKMEKIEGRILGLGMKV